MVDQQHIQAAQTGLCMLASIKKWIKMLADSGTSKNLWIFYAILLPISLALNARPANKYKHKFQPGHI